MTTPTCLFCVGAPACLAEGTRIPYRRGRRHSAAGRTLPIEALYEKFNGLHGPGMGHVHGAPVWAPELSTYLQSWDEARGCLTFNEVLSVVASGTKDCVRLTTYAGRVLELTDDHLILTECGTFEKAGDLRPGDEVRVRGTMRPRPSPGLPPPKNGRVTVETLKFHPYAARHSVVEPTSGKRYEYGRAFRARLVVEAGLNGLPYDEYVRVLKEDPDAAESLVYLDPDLEVHHRDRNPANDALENLVALTAEQHAAEHRDDNVARLNVEHTTVDAVCSVTRIGPRRTFDISMAAPHHNFVVDEGFIVHNCGKTTLIRLLLDYLDPSQARYLVPKPKWTVVDGVFAAAGHYTGGTFDGADTVPYNGVQDALEHWAVTPALNGGLTIFDGDRFSHESAARYLDKSSVGGKDRPGPDVAIRVVWLVATARELTERRTKRGTKQSASWALGRETKARRFAEGGWGPVLRLDAGRAPENLLGDLVSWLHSDPRTS